jgi:hypothetical protein
MRIGSLRVVVYLNDHRSAHVHVIGHDHEAVFQLDCQAGSAALRENYGFTARNVARIQDALQENLVLLCRAWENLHGIG